MAIYHKFDAVWIHTSDGERDGQVMVIENNSPKYNYGERPDPIILQYNLVQEYVKDPDSVRDLHKWICNQADAYEVLALMIRFLQEVDGSYYELKRKDKNV